MKTKLCIYSLVIIGFLEILIGCNKEEVELPIVTTSMATEIGNISAICKGTIVSNGGSEIIERGFVDMQHEVYYPDKKPYNSDIFIVPITGLEEDTPYGLFAYATNSEGMALSEEITVETLLNPICGVSNVSVNSILLHGYVGQNPSNANRTPSTAVFEYGTSTQYGEEIKTSLSQLTEGFYIFGDTFDALLDGLTPNTEYHYRLKASNSEVTIYSQDYTFRTLNTLTVTDIDGNIYNTVTIGTQIWMVENLKVTKYNNGTPIPLITDSEKWKFINTPAYCWYNNDEAKYKNIFGALYSSYTLIDGDICPTGWHIPTMDEWQTLETYLGEEEIAGYKLKDFKWRGSNSSCFSAQMSGERDYFNGDFQWGDDYYGFWWLPTEYDALNFRSMELCWKCSYTWLIGGPKSNGRSIRCIKD